MPLKTPPKRTQQLKLRTLSLSSHWRLEQWAKDMKLGKTEAAEKILDEFLKKNVKLEVEA